MFRDMGGERRGGIDLFVYLTEFNKSSVMNLDGVLGDEIEWAFSKHIFLNHDIPLFFYRGFYSETHPRSTIE